MSKHKEFYAEITPRESLAFPWQINVFNAEDENKFFVVDSGLAKTNPEAKQIAKELLERAYKIAIHMETETEVVNL